MFIVHYTAFRYCTVPVLVLTWQCAVSHFGHSDYGREVFCVLRTRIFRFKFLAHNRPPLPPIKATSAFPPGDWTSECQVGLGWA